MTFRNIGSLFDRKKKELKFTKNINLEIKEVLRGFLRTHYGDNLDKFNFTMEYNSSEKTLSIITENKTIANELSFNLGNINNFFRTRGIQLNRILIR